jgi:tryptophanyl-tRNA synthetase
MENHIGAEGADGLSTMTHSIGTTADVSQQINSWSVAGAVVDGKLQAIDYNRLVKTFGTRG